MTNLIGRNRNTNDEAVISDGITLNPNTSVKIADANPHRLFFHVTSNGSNQNVWVKLQPTDDDDDMKGIFLGTRVIGNNSWEMPADLVYTGEICAIADTDNPEVFVTEY